MKSVIDCTLLTVASTESKKEAGVFFSNVTVMQGEEVLKFNCENDLVDKLKAHKMKPVKLVLNISEYDNKKSLKVCDISL